MKRRDLLLGAAGFGLAGPAGLPFAKRAVAAGRVTASAVTPALTLLEGGGGNVLVLTTDAGQVLVDSGAAEFRDDLLATLAELPGAGRVPMLLNTHWHLDQVGANEALGLAGTTIVAHEKTRLRLSTGYYVPAEDRYEQPLPAAGRPQRTFYTEDGLEVGGSRIELGYLIEAHTDGDMYVHFPASNVVAAGDVISPVRDPALDWFGGGWLGGRVDALARLLELGDESTRFVPSYGPVVGRAEVEAEHALMLDLFERMVEHVRLGESAEDMLEVGVMEGLGRSFDDPYRFLYDAHKGLWAHHNKLMPDIV